MNDRTNDQQLTIKRGNSGNSRAFSQLIIISAPLFFPVLLGPHLDNFMENAYQKSGNLFSHQHTWFIETQGKITGMLLGYAGDVKRNEVLPTGLLYFKHFIKYWFFQKIIFLLKSQNFFPKVKETISISVILLYFLNTRTAVLEPVSLNLPSLKL